jgi:hypothetical protein
MAWFTNSKADGPHLRIGLNVLKKYSQPLKRVGLELIEKRIHEGIIAPKEGLLINWVLMRYSSG